MTPIVIGAEHGSGLDWFCLPTPASSRMDVFHVEHGSPLVGTFLQIDRLRQLGEDWDSYGSPPPSEALIRVAEVFVSSVDRQLAPFLPAPQVVPVSGGGLQFEWESGSRELEVEFGPLSDGSLAVEFLRSSHGEPIQEGTVSSVGELLAHLGWLAGD